MTARYRTTVRTFIAPHTIEPGSIIETDSEPSLAWEPLNPEAEEAKDKLYNKKYKHYDDKGNLVETQPLQDKRPQPIVNPNANRPTVELIHGPAADDAPSLSLAESNLSRAEPDLVPRGDGTSQLTAARPSSPPSAPTQAPIHPGDESVDGKVTIVAPAAAQPKTPGLI